MTVPDLAPERGGRETVRGKRTAPRRPLTAVVVGSRPLDREGGVEAICRVLVRALVERGWRVSYTGAEVSVPNWVTGGGPWRHLGRAATQFFSAGPTVGRNEQPDLSVTNGPLGWRVRGANATHLYHGTFVGEAAALRKQIRARGYARMRYLDGMVFERLAGKGKRCLANSGRTAREVMEHFGHRCEVVWAPVDVSAFSPGPPDERLLDRLGLPLDRPLGLFIGAGRPSKGASLAYQVMERARDVDWVVLGDRELPPAGFRGRVHLRHTVRPEAMPALYRSVQLLLVTSLYEAFGMVVAEALSCGTPVVAGPTGAGDLLMAHSSLLPYTVPNPHDTDRLADAVERVLADSDAARRAALRGREVAVTRLSHQTWINLFLDAAGVQGGNS
jgi:glycosyltransferase involved in cell wall biosynthesis